MGNRSRSPHRRQGALVHVLKRQRRPTRDESHDILGRVLARLQRRRGDARHWRAGASQGHQVADDEHIRVTWHTLTQAANPEKPGDRLQPVTPPYSSIKLNKEKNQTGKLVRAALKLATMKGVLP